MARRDVYGTVMLALAAALGVGCTPSRSVTVSTSSTSPAPSAATVVAASAATAAPPVEVGALAALVAALGDAGAEVASADGDPVRHTSPCTDGAERVEIDGQQVTLRHGGCFRCKLAGVIPAGLEARVHAFAQAFVDTPASLLRAAHLARVALCAELEYERGPDGDDLVGGTVDHLRRELLLSVDEVFPLPGADVLHHELFHLFETATSPRTTFRDPEWTAHNPPDFRYGRHEDGTVVAGFLNTHAMRNLREDHATVYQFIMARPTELCASDARLLGKARLLGARIRAVIGAADAAYLVRRAPCLAEP
ncbi:MAG: hypothetical protein IT373_17980 [Polyangiaceae bacterium]|nr:hypothetical protein [Polyangiaceae bacterium]